MAADVAGVEEGWFHITLYLPVATPQEILAANRTIRFLSAHYGGVTASGVRPAVFQGYWKDPSTGTWYQDRICVVTVDFYAPDALESGVDQDIDIIKMYAFGYYEMSNAPQKEIWIFVSPESRGKYLPPT